MVRKMNSLKEIAKVLKKSNKIALFGHISTDFDALGSLFSLYHSLKSLGKQPTVFVQDKLTEQQKLFVDVDLIESGDCDISAFDTFVCCDVSDKKMLGKYAHIYNCTNNTIVLDHHVATQLIGKYNYIDASMSSCSELVYELLKLLKVRFTSKILSYVYIGLSSDTKSFVNSNTNEHSFKVAYEIAKFGIDMNRVNEVLYKTKTRKEISFQQYLWNNYKIQRDCAYFTIDYKTLQELKGDHTNCSGFSGKLICIEKVNYAFTIIEKEPGLLTVSLRSKMGYNVRKVAEKFGGGGHICASGASVKNVKIPQIKNEILKSIKEMDAAVKR